MVGIDLIEIERIKKSAENPGFLKKIFTDGEIAYYESTGKRAETLAGMWSAKEATAKAVGVGFNRGFGMSDIEIAHNDLGAPFVLLSDKAAPFFSKFNIFISITHNNATAAAVCCLYNK